MSYWYPKAEIQIGEMPRHTLRIELTWYGGERYYVDGKEIKKCWGLRFKGSRFLKVGCHDVEYRVNIWQALSAIYIDGELYSEQIFPEYVKYRQKYLLNQQQMAAQKKEQPTVSLLKPTTDNKGQEHSVTQPFKFPAVAKIIVWVSVAFILFAIFKAVEERPPKFRFDKPPPTRESQPIDNNSQFI